MVCLWYTPVLWGGMYAKIAKQLDMRKFDIKLFGVSAIFDGDSLATQIDFMLGCSASHEKSLLTLHTWVALCKIFSM